MRRSLAVSGASAAAVCPGHAHIRPHARVACAASPFRQGCRSLASSPTRPAMAADSENNPDPNASKSQLPSRWTSRPVRAAASARAGTRPSPAASSVLRVATAATAKAVSSSNPESVDTMAPRPKTTPIWIKSSPNSETSNLSTDPDAESSPSDDAAPARSKLARPSATDRLLRDQTADHLDRLIARNKPHEDSESLWDLGRMLLHMDPQFAFESQPLRQSWNTLLAMIAESGHAGKHGSIGANDQGARARQRIERLLLWRAGISPDTHSDTDQTKRNDSKSFKLDLAKHPSATSITPEDLVHLVRASTLTDAQSTWKLLASIRARFGTPAKHHNVIHAAILSLALSTSVAKASRLVDLFETHNAKNTGLYSDTGAVHYNYLLQMLCAECTRLRNDKTALENAKDRSQRTAVREFGTFHMNSETTDVSDQYENDPESNQSRTEATITSLMHALVTYMGRMHIPRDVITFNYLARVTEFQKFNSVQKFLERMDQAGVVPNSKTYCELITRLGVSDARRLMVVADRNGIQAHADMLHAYLVHCHRNDNTASGLDMLLNMPRWKELISPKYLDNTLDYFLEAAACSRVKVGAALEFAHLMQRRKYQPNPNFIAALVRTLSHVGRAEDAAEITLLLSAGNLRETYLPFRSRMSILIGLRNKGNAIGAIQFVRDMMSLGFAPMDIAHSMILEILVKHQRFAMAQQWLDILFTQNHAMSIKSVNVLLNAFVRLGRTQEADALVARLPKWQLVPNDTTHECILTSMLCRNRVQDALTYVSDLTRRHGDGLSSYLYTPLMQFYIGTAQWGRVHGLWTTVLDRETVRGGSIRSVGDVFLAVYIRALHIQRKFDAIVALHDEMVKQERLELDCEAVDRCDGSSVVSSGSDVEGSSNRDHGKVGEKYMPLSVQRRSGIYLGVGFDPIAHPKSLRSILSAYLRSREPDRAKKLLNDVISQLTDADLRRMRHIGGLLPGSTESEITQTNLQAIVHRSHNVRAPIREISESICDFISYFSTKGDIEEAERYLKEHLDKFMSSRPFIALIRAVSRHHDDLKRARMYWRTMCDRGINLDEQAYAAMFSAYVHAGAVSGAVSLFNEFRDRGMMPTERMYNTLIVLYGRLGSADQIECMVRHLRQRCGYGQRNRFELGISTMNAMMTGYMYSNRLDKAWSIWKRLWRGSALIELEIQREEMQKRWREQYAMQQVAGSGKSAGALNETGDSEHESAASPVNIHDMDDEQGRDEIDEVLFASRSNSHINMRQGEQSIHENLYGVTQVTVSLALDVLGSSQRLSELDDLWQELHQAKFPLEENNYTSYMEALVRCGQGDRAISVVTDILPAELPHVRPSFKTLRNLVNLLGVNTPEGSRAWAYVQRHFPEYVDQIRQITTLSTVTELSPGDDVTSESTRSTRARHSSTTDTVNETTSSMPSVQALTTKRVYKVPYPKFDLRDPLLLPPVRELLAFEEMVLGRSNISQMMFQRPKGQQQK